MVFVVTGCVKKSVHEATLKDLDDVKAQLAASDQKGKALQEALDAEQAEVAELEKKISQLSAAIAAVEKVLANQKEAYAKLNEQLADTVKDKAKLKESADELKKALAELQARKAEAEARVAEFKDLLAKFRSLIDAGKLKVQIRNGRMVLVLPSDILFASGSAELSDDGEAAIQEVAGVLSTIKDREFQVEGHTDNVPIVSKKKFKNNWDLAAARSSVVLDAMIEAGMKGDKLSAASYGEYRPVARNDSEAGKAQNRRIDIVIVPDLSTLPGFNELQAAVSGN